MTRAPLTIRQVEGAAELAAVRGLLEEYGRTPDWAVCFTTFEKELALLPGPCRPPEGRLLAAWAGGVAGGCVALQPLGGGDVELRRLYVRPAMRGMGIGRALAERAIEEARASGHRRIRLHTLPSMRAAHALYEAAGFRPSEPYGGVGVEGAIFLALDLGPTTRRS